MRDCVISILINGISFSVFFIKTNTCFCNILFEKRLKEYLQHQKLLEKKLVISIRVVISEVHVLRYKDSRSRKAEFCEVDAYEFLNEQYGTKQQLQ